MNAETLMLAGGLGAFLLTLWWVRRRELREKYAVVWMLVASLVLLCGLFPESIKTAAEASHLSYPTAVLFLSLGAIYVYAFTVSVSLTRQYRKSVRLAQEVALLEARLRALEKALEQRGGAGPAVAE